MRPAHRRVLRARVVMPVARPPIDDGAVLVHGSRIEAVGRMDELAIPPGTPVEDLGGVILLPGLVNAHCHLDYTDMAGMVPASRQFTDWIKSITTLKATWSYTEYAHSWTNGAAMLLRNGVTTVADIEAAPELLPEVWEATPLRVHSFLEMTGVRSRRDPRAIVEDAISIIDSLPPGRSRAGLSPHAPYSTTPELLRLAKEASQNRNWWLTTHLAESREEFEMFTQAAGVLHDWLARNERNMSDCGHGSPVRHLHELGYLSAQLLAVHVNCLAEGDAELLSSTGSHVVHCPQSHSFFAHPEFPLAKLQQVGVNLCLGTDSLASTRKRNVRKLELNLFDEMREFSAAHPDVHASSIIEMATVNGARALGQAGQIGELSPEALADLIALPFAGSLEECAAAVVQHRGPVAASMIDGEWAIAPTALIA